MDYLLGSHHAAKGGCWTLQRYASAMLEERCRRIMRRSDTKDFSVAEIHISERSLANAHRICEHGLKDRLQLPGRRRDDLQDLRRRRLLLKDLGKLARARRRLVMKQIAFETGTGPGARQRRSK